jgi:GDP-mannose transporter
MKDKLDSTEEEVEELLSKSTSSTNVLDQQIARSSERLAERGATAFAVCGYALCSSCMLVTNKVAVHVLPAPSLVLFLQLASAAVSVWGCGAVGLISVDALSWPKVKGFAPVALAFLGVIFANIKTLQCVRTISDLTCPPDF